MAPALSLRPCISASSSNWWSVLLLPLSLPQFCVLLVLSLARKKEMFCFCFETDPFGFNAERKCSLNFQVVYKEMSEKFEFFEFLVCECFFPLKIKKVLPQK
jgi:hypothetical protein